MPHATDPNLSSTTEEEFNRKVKSFCGNKNKSSEVENSGKSFGKMWQKKLRTKQRFNAARTRVRKASRRGQSFGSSPCDSAFSEPLLQTSVNPWNPLKKKITHHFSPVSPRGRCTLSLSFTCGWNPDKYSGCLEWTLINSQTIKTFYYPAPDKTGETWQKNDKTEANMVIWMIIYSKRSRLIRFNPWAASLEPLTTEDISQTKGIWSKRVRSEITEDRTEQARKATAELLDPDSRTTAWRVLTVWCVHGPRLPQLLDSDGGQNSRFTWSCVGFNPISLFALICWAFYLE